MSVYTVIECDRCGFRYKADGVVSLGCLYTWSTFAMDGQSDCCHSCLLKLRDEGRAASLGGAAGAEFFAAVDASYLDPSTDYVGPLVQVSDSTIPPSTIRCVSCGGPAGHGIALRGEIFCEGCGALFAELNRGNT